MTGILTVFRMPAVAVMHEQMHEWASQQWKPHHDAQQMGAMLHPEVDARNRQEADHD